MNIVLFLKTINFSPHNDVVSQMGASCTIACVASVSVLFRSKDRPRNEILGFGCARNETRAKK